MHRELRNLRVAFVAGTLGQGGAERQLFYMLKALHGAGADVRVLCLTQHEFWEQRIRDLGVAVTYLGERASRLARLTAIVSNLRLRRPHIVQSQHFYTNLYASLAARAVGIPEIGAIRNDVLSEVRANGRILGKWSLRMPRVLAANSRLGIANAVQLGIPEQRVRFLPNVVDTDSFVPGNAHVRNSLHILGVGRLVEQKRFDRFLSVIAKLRKQRDLDIRATIVGAGPLRDTLEQQAKQLGIESVVEFAGAAPDMRVHYAAADLLVLTSDWEGTPNVVLEAMAAGLPVVSTRVGGVVDILRDGQTGVVVNASAEPLLQENICNAIVALGTDVQPRRDLAAAARSFVVEHHSLQALPRILSGLYGSLTS